MADVQLPRNHDYRLGAVREFSEVNRWGSEVDARLVEIIACLGESVRRVNILTTKSTPSASVGAHAPQHAPQTGFDPLATAAHTGGYGLTTTVGTSDNLLRADARLLYPTALAEYSFNTTFTLTSDGTNQTVTGSSGDLIFRSASHGVDFDYWVSAGTSAFAVAGTVMNFSAQSLIAGTSLSTGIAGLMTWNSGSYTGNILRGMNLTATATTSGSYTSVEMRVLDISLGASSSLSGTNTFTTRIGIRLSMGNAIGASTTTTDTYGIFMNTWTTIGVTSTNTNVTACRLAFPPLGTTIRRGLWISTQTTNGGTEATTTEGVYMEPLARGTTNRYSYWASGSTTGTPTAVYGYYSEAHTVGTDRWSFYGNNKAQIAGSDYIASTTAKGLICTDSQPRYWRITADTSGTTPSVSATLAVDANQILTVTRGASPAGTVNLKVVDVGTTLPTT